MLDHDSIAAWLLGARAGESAAAQEIWQRYFARLVQLAREKVVQAEAAEHGSGILRET